MSLFVVISASIALVVELAVIICCQVYLVNMYFWVLVPAVLACTNTYSSPASDPHSPMHFNGTASLGYGGLTSGLVSLSSVQTTPDTETSVLFNYNKDASADPLTLATATLENDEFCTSHVLMTGFLPVTQQCSCYWIDATSFANLSLATSSRYFLRFVGEDQKSFVATTMLFRLDTGISRVPATVSGSPNGKNQTVAAAGVRAVAACSAVLVALVAFL